MIDITNIHDGWLTLTIGDKSFGVSYLTDVKGELNRLYNPPEIYGVENPMAKNLYFDGEGKDLYLTIRKEYDNIIILWEELSDKVYLYRFEFPYEEFYQEWLNVWDRIKDEYYEHFDLNSLCQKNMERNFE